MFAAMKLGNREYVIPSWVRYQDKAWNRKKIKNKLNQKIFEKGVNKKIGNGFAMIRGFNDCIFLL